MGTDRKFVQWESYGAVALITIDNPPLNLLSLQVRHELEECVQEIGDDPGVRVVVITGAGQRAFSAGSDVREFPNRPGEGRERCHFEHHNFNLIAGLPKPSIAALNGLAFGGGLELALSCDLRVASEGVMLAVPEVKLGVFPSGGGTQRLTRLVGNAKARELMYLGDPIPAQEALGIGLVNRVAPAGKAVEVALELAVQIASRPAVAVRAIKAACDFARDHTLSEGFDLEADLIDQVFVSHDAQEGVAALLAKRPPRFEHR
jgi:enoyl-CoA hydratase/carnithine racemase